MRPGIISSRLVTALFIILILFGTFAGADHLQFASSGTSAPLTGQHLGFWIAEDDIWSGQTVTGNNPPWTPQQFFDNYFLTPPYPSTMQWTTGLTPSGPYAPTSNGEAEWLANVSAKADSYPAIQNTILIFVNLSNQSIVTYEGTHSPNFLVNRISNPSVDPNKTGSWNKFSVTGLTASKSYSIVLNTNLNITMATITTFVANSTGGYSGYFQIPNEPESQNLWYVSIQGTNISYTVALQADQTQDLTSYMNILKGHRSIYGAQYEPEYFGNSAQENQNFCTIVTNAGYVCIQGPGGNFPAVDYSSYPYYGGIVYTDAQITNPPYIGIGYGEVGSPNCPNCPAWTQSVVTNIVNNSASKIPFTYIYSELDTNNPIGNSLLWNNPMLRGWIWNDPSYQTHYVLSNSVSPTSSTTSTTTVSSTSISGQPSPTISPISGAPPPATGGLIFSSGPPEVNPQSNLVYSQNPFLMRFYLPQAVSSFDLKFYASTVGTISSPLYVAILSDSNQGYQTGTPIFSSVLYNSTAIGITSSANWITQQVSMSLAPGYYWAAFSTSGGASADYYAVQSNNQIAYPDIFCMIPRQVGSGLAGSIKVDLGSALWITDSSGNTLSVYPLLSEATNFRAIGSSVSLKVPQNMKINTIAFFLSDRAFDPNNITISLEQGSTILATGMFSSQIFRGINGLSYTPVQLNQVVTLEPGVSYTIVFGNLPASDYYNGNLGGGVSQDLITSSANPSFAGYLGQSSWPLFTLGLLNVNYAISFPDYISSTDLFDSPGYHGDEVALRFQATQDENIQSFSVNVIQVNTLTGSLSVTLRANDNGRPTPLSVSPALASGSISYASVSSNLTSCATNTGKCTFAKTYFSGSTQLTAGQYYWIVMSGNIGLNRLVGPYSDLVFTSSNDFTSSWGVPGDGPTDLAYQIVTSGQTMSNTYIGQTLFPIGGSQMIAQSFSVPTSLSLKGIWIHTGRGYNLNVAIEQDSGSNSPSGTAIGTATIPAYGASNSMNYASLPNPLTLSAGTKYWIVVSGGCAYSACSSPDYIYANQYRSDDQNKYGSSFEYQTSSNAGSTWSASNPNGDMSFILSGYNSSQIMQTTTTLTTSYTTQTSSTSTSFSSTATSTTSSKSTLGYISIQGPAGSVNSGSSLALSGLTEQSPSGSIAPMVTIYIWVNGQYRGAVTSDSDGYWSFSFTPQIGGTYYISASQKPDGSGITSQELAVTVASASMTSTITSSTSSTSITTSSASSTTFASTTKHTSLTTSTTILTQASASTTTPESSATANSTMYQFSTTTSGLTRTLTTTSTSAALISTPNPTTTHSSSNTSSGSRGQTKPANLAEIFTSIPYLTSSPSPLGVIVFACELGLVAATPFVIRKIARETRREKDKDKSRVWRW